MRLAAVALVLVALLAVDARAARAPMASCGDMTVGNGLLISDVTARRVPCREARRIARLVPGRCGDNGPCSVRGFSCLTALAAEELRFARCVRPRGNQELYRVVRFDWGS